MCLSGEEDQGLAIGDSAWDSPKGTPNRDTPDLVGQRNGHTLDAVGHEQALYRTGTQALDGGGKSAIRG
jgi:hypothetical protein